MNFNTSRRARTEASWVEVPINNESAPDRAPYRFRGSVPADTNWWVGTTEGMTITDVLLAAVHPDQRDILTDDMRSTVPAYMIDLATAQEVYLHLQEVWNLRPTEPSSRSSRTPSATARG